jgi:hypothetical protein
MKMILDEEDKNVLKGCGLDRKGRKEEAEKS